MRTKHAIKHDLVVFHTTFDENIVTLDALKLGPSSNYKLSSTRPSKQGVQGCVGKGKFESSHDSRFILDHVVTSTVCYATCLGQLSPVSCRSLSPLWESLPWSP